MITYQREEWQDCLAEMEQLWPLHWEEVAADKDVIPLEPNYEMYDWIDQNGQLHVVTVRCDGKLIGYHTSIVRPHLHYKSSLSAFTDMYFIHPDYRSAKGGRARRLCEFSKQAADSLGIPLIIGVLSNNRTEAKVRLYKRQFGEPSGAFFLYNARTGGWKDAAE